MKRAVQIAGALVTVALIPIITSMLPSVLPASLVVVAEIVLIALVLLYFAWRAALAFPQVWLRLSRGVTAVASDRDRTRQFSKPWVMADTEIYSWGVGMTNLVRDEGEIEKSVARGVRVRLELVDAGWVREHPEISTMIDETYGRSRFVEQIEESTKRLVRIAQKLNKVHGEDSVKVWAVQSFTPQSGTVADPKGERAWGWVEWHTFGFPHGQVRLRMRNYPHGSPLNPPLLEHVLQSRKSIPRKRIDTIREISASWAEDENPVLE